MNVSSLANRVVNPSGRPSDADLRAAVAGKVVLVTGASHGIGRASATKLAGAGATVLAVARSADELQALATETGAHAYPADLSDLDAVERLAERLQADHGPVDVVVNNAGRSIRRSIEESYDRFHDFQRLIDVNYLGPVRLLLGLLPAMRAQGSGHIVNVSTIGVVVPPAPRWSAYQASKAAFDVWLRSVAAETRSDGVTATSIYMALVHTRMSAPTYSSRRVPGLRPEQAADLVAQAIVERPPAITPWWASLAGVLDNVARGPSAALMHRFDHRLA